MANHETKPVDEKLVVCARLVIYFSGQVIRALHSVREFLEIDSFGATRGDTSPGRCSKGEDEDKRTREIEDIAELVLRQKIIVDALLPLPDEAGVGGDFRNVYNRCWTELKKGLSDLHNRVQQLTKFLRPQTVVCSVEEMHTDIQSLQGYAADFMEYGCAHSAASKQFEDRYLSPDDPPDSTVSRIDQKHEEILRRHPKLRKYGPEDLLDKRQIATAIGLSHRTIEKYFPSKKNEGPLLPKPDGKGGGCGPLQWRRDAVLSWLVTRDEWRSREKE